MKKISTLFLIGFLTIVPLAQAHYLWLEKPNAEKNENRTVDIFYGEYEEGLREKSGGRLDEVTPITAWVDGVEVDSKKGLEKKDSFYELKLPSDLRSGSLLQAEELARPVQDWKKYDIGIVKPNYYTGTLLRAFGEDEMFPTPDFKTRLAVIPIQLGETSVVQVYFDQKPLPNAKVLVHAPNEWTKEWKTDEAGKITAKLPWSGFYVFEVIHNEKKSGEFEGKAYESIRHRATFSYARG